MVTADFSRVFACRHEYVAKPGYFLCYKCQHIREELPFSRDNRKALLFFPVSVRAEAAEANAG